MRPHAVIILGSACLLWLGACDKKNGEEAQEPTAAPAEEPFDCPPLTVTLDGEPFPVELSHAVAYRESVSHGYLIERFNHPVTCEEAMQSPRTVPSGEVVVRVWTDGFQGSVSVGASANFTDAIRVGPTPDGPGETMEVCVTEPVELVGTGDFRDRTVHVEGLFAADYCGEQP